MPKATLDSGLTLHYQQTGSGPDLVLVHGLTGNLAVWHLAMVPMLARHFRVLTYDLRGHGYSEAPPTGYTHDDMAADLLGLLDALGIGQVDVVGHSFGADTALYFAHDHPDRVRRVVAIEAALPAMIHRRLREDWPGWKQWSEVLDRSGVVVPHERRADADYLLRRSLEIPKKWGPLRGLPRNPRPTLRLLDATTVISDHEVIGGLSLAEVEQIRTPVTLLYSEGSHFGETYDYLSAHLPDVRPVRLPDTDWGHFGPLEQPENVVEEVLLALAQPTSAPLADGTPGQGRSVIVTGASTGLGLEVALELAAAGFAVYATVRDLTMSADVKGAAAERCVDLKILRLDLTDEDSIAQAVATVVAETGAVYALVNNGGLGLRGCLEDLTSAEIRNLFDTNVVGTMAATRAVLPSMRAAGRGRIVTISSVGGRISSFGISAYCASKFAQEGFGEALAMEVAPFGIQAVLVEPGIIPTSRWSTNRATAPGALSPDSPYAALFTAAEGLADQLVKRSRNRPADVARCVLTALTVDKPRLRYGVGQPAGLVVLARRYLPERTFERLYFGAIMKRVAREAAKLPSPDSAPATPVEPAPSVVGA